MALILITTRVLNQIKIFLIVAAILATSPRGSALSLRRENYPEKLLHFNKGTNFEEFEPELSRYGPTADYLHEDVNGMSFGQAVVLAMEQIKCVFASNDSQKDMPGLTAVVERCSRPEISTQCEQCKNLTSKPISSPHECQHACNSANLLCNNTCLAVFEELKEKSGLYDTYHSIRERLNEVMQGQSSSFYPNSTGSLEATDNPVQKAVEGIFRESLETNQDKGRGGYLVSLDFLRSVLPMPKGWNSFIHEPKPFCEGVYNRTTKSPKHIVFLKWFGRGGGENKSTGEKVKPVVYVIEQKMGNDTEWVTIGKTEFDLLSVNVAYSTKYKWRITAVGANGIVDVKETKEYQTLEGYRKPGPPKELYVVNTKKENSSVSVLIGWEPPDEKPCSYKIVLVGQNGKVIETVRIKDPLGVHQYWFRNLNFGYLYHVRITSRDTIWDENESSSKQLQFKAPTCLESFNRRFDLCAPPPISEQAISAEIQLLKGDLQDGLQRFQVLLTWSPPANTSEDNPLEKYTVKVIPISLSLNFMDGNHLQNYTVPGNVTHLVLKNLKNDMEYTVLITAYSVGGVSPPTRYNLHTKLKYTAEIGNWIYISSIFFLLTLLLCCCNLGRIYYHRRNVKKARIEYFRSMEDGDEMGEFSIVPLTEDSFKWKLFDVNFPREKWEICWNDLTLGEVIGQGAFGVVRRAKIRKDRLEQKLRFRGEDEAWLNSADRNVDKTDPDMETVAVKLVKVSSTLDDREQLIKEITMMQNLGFQPQIVGLLGACARGRTLCLVLEYCPGGDLLTFIRKVREKYWPNMGLSSQRSPTTVSGFEQSVINKLTKSCGQSGTHGGQENVILGSNGSKSFENYPAITYADVGGFPECCSSPEGSIPLPGFQESSWGSIRRDLHSARSDQCSMPPLLSDPVPKESDEDDDEDNFRPIDEKDVLSYARQISMGMEFLEKNRVVHRDLACRNVLLMGDYKHVKISDFGLSRDIYTRNVYQQKSNGKLPFKWMAIESLFSHVFTTKSDVWSFGILLWELVTLGGTPYPGMGNTELFRYLKSGCRMERPDNCSDELYAVMKKCWRSEAGHRPSFFELRRYLETMMEAAEPNLYLSLQADIPPDFFALKGRNDGHLGREYDNPLTPLEIGGDLPFSRGSSRQSSITRPPRNSNTSQANRPRKLSQSHSFYHNVSFHEMQIMSQSQQPNGSPISGIGSWNSNVNTNPINSPVMEDHKKEDEEDGDDECFQGEESPLALDLDPSTQEPCNSGIPHSSRKSSKIKEKFPSSIDILSSPDSGILMQHQFQTRIEMKISRQRQKKNRLNEHKLTRSHSQPSSPVGSNAIGHRPRMTLPFVHVNDMTIIENRTYYDMMES